MVIERLGERCWDAALEGTYLRMGGLTLDLEALSGPEPRRVVVYADAEGRATLEATDWLGAEVFLPPRGAEPVQVGEEVYESEEGQVVRQPVYAYQPQPLRVELVRVRLFALPVVGFGGEA